jgi:2-alkyl-3-oxoalkanoate reductase
VGRSFSGLLSMTLKIAVTGATGFVGKALIPRLIHSGHRLSLLVRNPNSAQFPNSVRVIRGDLHSLPALQDLTQNVDVVLHVAGVVSAVRRADFLTANCEGTIALATAAKANGVKRFVYVSSLAAREPGLAAYGESKAAAEQALLSMAAPMEVCILRPAAVYGRGDTATLPLLQALMSKTAFIPGTADAAFAMVHVDDMARALVEAVQGANGTFELHDGSAGHSWPELIAITRQHFGTPRRVVYLPKAMAMGLGHLGDAIARLRNRVSFASTAQIKQIYHPDWRVTSKVWPMQKPIHLQDGLPQTIRWYQAQGLLPQRQVADRSATDRANTG